MTVYGWVYDGWGEWRCRIEERTSRRGKHQWRWVLDYKFVRITDAQERGRWTSDRDKAHRNGERRLLNKEQTFDGVVL